MFDKLKFWKKDDDFSWDDSSLPQDTHSSQDPFAQQDGLGQQGESRFADKLNAIQQDPYQRGYSPQDPYPQQPSAPNREMELVLAKLDVIAKELDSMHQRIRRIEAASEPTTAQKRYW